MEATNELVEVAVGEVRLAGVLLLAVDDALVGVAMAF